MYRRARVGKGTKVHLAHVSDYGEVVVVCGAGCCGFSSTRKVSKVTSVYDRTVKITCKSCLKEIERFDIVISEVSDFVVGSDLECIDENDLTIDLPYGEPDYGLDR